MLKVAESIGLKLRFRSDSLISMMNYDSNPYFDPEISNKLRDFNEQNLNS